MFVLHSHVRRAAGITMATSGKVVGAGLCAMRPNPRVPRPPTHPTHADTGQGERGTHCRHALRGELGAEPVLCGTGPVGACGPRGATLPSARAWAEHNGDSKLFPLPPVDASLPLPAVRLGCGHVHVGTAGSRGWEEDDRVAQPSPCRPDWRLTNSSRALPGRLQRCVHSTVSQQTCSRWHRRPLPPSPSCTGPPRPHCGRA
jgi:hypothetical protein